MAHIDSKMSFPLGKLEIRKSLQCLCSQLMLTSLMDEFRNSLQPVSFVAWSNYMV